MLATGIAGMKWLIARCGNLAPSSDCSFPALPPEQRHLEAGYRKSDQTRYVLQKPLRQAVGLHWFLAVADIKWCDFPIPSAWNFQDDE